MRGICVSFASMMFLAALVASPVQASEAAEPSTLFSASATPLPCDAASSAAAAEPLAELDLEPLQELPVTPVEPTEKAVTCGSWTYVGCCISQTKYRRRCQFNPAEWWYEYKCQGVCVM